MQYRGTQFHIRSTVFFVLLHTLCIAKSGTVETVQTVLEATPLLTYLSQTRFKMFR